VPLRSDASKPLSLTERAIQDIRKAILRLDHAPGSALRLEALQAQYGLSSSPLREALSRLVADGLVHQESNRGFRVAELTAEELADLTQMRMLVEPPGLAQSIQHGDEVWEGRVVAAHHRLQRAEEGLAELQPALSEPWSIAHRTFHLELFSGCPSARMRRECTRLFDEAERYRWGTARLRRIPRKKDVEHAMLVEAALGRDAERATKLLRDHIEFAAASMKDILLDGAFQIEKPSLNSAG
jgi:GntR family transcriptional regulator, carbon starvation induced regulator